jgi:hypothetical protein
LWSSSREKEEKEERKQQARNREYSSQVGSVYYRFTSHLNMIGWCSY